MSIGGAVAVVGVGLLFAVPAIAGKTTNVPLHPGQAPTTAGQFASKDCSDLGTKVGQDGWHFVTLGKADFVHLTLTFKDSGGTTHELADPPITFGSGGKHAYAYTPAGWTLIAGTAAITEGSPQEFFNLSHVCLPKVPTPSPSPSPSPSKSPSPEASKSPSSGPSATASTSPGVTAGPSTPASPAVSPTAGPLPTTGSSLTVVIVAGFAMLAAGVVVFVVSRRRRSTFSA